MLKDWQKTRRKQSSSTAKDAWRAAEVKPSRFDIAFSDTGRASAHAFFREKFGEKWGQLRAKECFTAEQKLHILEAILHLGVEYNLLVSALVIESSKAGYDMLYYPKI